ncbi:Rv3654c family TadE-like protein [Streptomyces sioyaensis]|uniref:Rv3654c family TadE-like protein n=1 Tax=Streptomyces sioyaensis TaxID=67364 RepID=UPI0037B6A37D
MTVWTVFAAAALCAVFVALMGVGQAVTARHRAGGAADLAALAAADHALQGPAGACSAARRVAAAQHTRLVRCVVDGSIADVSAEAGSTPFTSRVRARAGPAGRPPEGRAGAWPVTDAAVGGPARVDDRPLSAVRHPPPTPPTTPVTPSTTPVTPSTAPAMPLWHPLGCVFK